MNGKVRDYKDLNVWRKALDVISEVLQLVEMFPPGPASRVVGEQMIRSSTSVSANIAEGQSSGSNREFNRILRIAYREAKETDNWLQVIRVSRKLAAPEILALVSSIEDKNIEVIKMLSGLRSRLFNADQPRGR